MVSEFDPEKVERYFDAYDKDKNLYLASDSWTPDPDDVRGTNWVTAKEYDTLLALYRSQQVRVKELEVGLRNLHDDVADYVTVNNLGNPHHNLFMQQARSLLSKTEESRIDSSEA